MAIITGILIPFFLGFFFAIYEHFRRFRDFETRRLINKYFTTHYNKKLKLYRSTYKVALKMYEDIPYGPKPLITPAGFIKEEDEEKMKASNAFIYDGPDYVISSAFWPITKLVILISLRAEGWVEKKCTYDACDHSCDHKWKYVNEE